MSNLKLAREHSWNLTSNINQDNVPCSIGYLISPRRISNVQVKFPIDVSRGQKVVVMFGPNNITTLTPVFDSNNRIIAVNTITEVEDDLK